MKGWVTNLVAPLSVPPPLRNAKLVSYFLFTRHGARAPIYPWSNYPLDQVKWKYGESYKNKSINRRIPIVNGVEVDFSKNAKSGRLLDIGIQQQESLGKLYYNYLVVQNNLLPHEDQYDLSKIFIRSSVSPRCVESASSFLQGMYNPKSSNEKLFIQTGKFGDEILCPHPELNEYYIKKSKIFQQTEEFRRRVSLIPQEIKDMFPNNEFTQLLAGDFPYCLKFNGYQLPKIIEEDNKRYQKITNRNSPCYGELYRLLASNLAYYSTGFIDFVGRDAYGPIFQLFNSHLKKFLNKETDVKFTLFSGHDVSISGFLVGLGIVNKEAVPPYASHLGAELWEANSQLSFRFTLNGEVLKIGNSDTIEIEQFINKYLEP